METLHFLFNGHDFKFLTPVMNYVSSRPDVETKVLTHAGHVLSDLKEAETLNAWADIVFCEWALGNAVWFSQHKRPGQLLVVRMHAQEFRARQLPYLGQMDWNAVDRLIVICPAGEKYARENLPIAQDRISLVYNPLDIAGRFSVQRFPFSDFTLGYLGMVPWMKRPDLALDIFQRCSATDSRFHLRIKGKRPQDYKWMLSRKEEMDRYNAFDAALEASPHRNAVHFDEFDPEPGRWYAQCGFILSTSDYEGSHQSVAEGMAQGCIPVIRDWEGASPLYPARYLWHDPSEAAAAVLSYRTDPWKYWQEAARCRDYAVANFDARSICLAYDALFAAHPRYRPLRETHPPKDLRIALLAFIPAGCHNGYRVRVEQFISQYHRLGLHVVLVCLHNGKASEADLARHRADLEKSGCTAYTVAMPHFFDMAFGDAALQDIRAGVLPVLRKEKIDWLQAEAAYTGRIGLAAKEMMPGLRFAFDSHGVSPEEDVMSGASEARIRATECIERTVLEGADFVLFVSHAMQTHFMAKYGMLKASMVVPCCIRRQALRGNVSGACPLAVPQDRLVLGYVGTMVAWQCKDEMFRLFGELHRRHPDVFFLVLTPQPDQKVAHDLLRANGVPEADCLVAELPFDQVPSALVRMNAGMMLRKESPVNRAASPTKFGEMIAAGIPVVATDGIGDYSGDLREHGFGVIVPRAELDSMEYSDATCEAVYSLLAERRNESPDFIARATRYCEETLFWENHAEALVEEYWKIVNVPV